MINSRTEEQKQTDKNNNPHDKLFNTLDRLLKKGIIYYERFTQANCGSFSSFVEESRHSDNMNILFKNPKINNKSDKITQKFKQLHYYKSDLQPQEAFNEFLGAVLIEFLYPDEGISPKNRLVLNRQTRTIGITSKSLSETIEMNANLNYTSLTSFYTTQELDIDCINLCKVMVSEDFIGLFDNHSSNRRKTRDGKIVRIDFEKISACSASRELSSSSRSSLDNSSVDLGICYTDEYINEVEKISRLNQSDLDLALKKVARIFDLYEPCCSYNPEKIYMLRIQQMNKYAEVLRLEQTKRSKLPKLEYLKIRCEELGISVKNNILDPRPSLKI